jgi:hypothetical protein
MNFTQILQPCFHALFTDVRDFNLTGKVVILELLNLAVEICKGAILMAGDENRLMFFKTIGGLDTIE